MSRGILVALAGGLLSAGLLLALTSGSPVAVILVYVVQMPLFLVGLALGVKLAVIAAGAGIALSLGAGGLLVGGLYAVVFAAPSLLVLRQALLSRPGDDGAPEWYPPGRLLCWIAGCAAVLLTAAAAAAAGAEGGLEGLIGRTLPEMLAQLSPTPLDPGMRAGLESLAAHFPAMFAVSWIMMTVLNGIISQALLVRAGRAVRPSPDMAAIEVPLGFVYALAGAAAAGLALPGALGFVGANMVPILAVPYFFVGLSIVHCYARPSSQRTLWLTLFYVVLIMFGFIAMLLVTGLGFAETWLGLRRRKAGV